MRSDNDLKRDVERELEWEPGIDHLRIGVAVSDGVVTLTGDVTSYAEKWRAERAVERVSGVRGIANEIAVRAPSDYTDTDIARAAADALLSNVLVPEKDIKVRVENGWITLTGVVEWDYQRRAAERTLGELPGVRGISNEIVVKPRVEPKELQKKIRETFERRAELDAKNITIQVTGSEVTLTGRVRSWSDRYEAERAAYAAPGVTVVHNHLVVEPSEVAA